MQLNTTTALLTALISAVIGFGLAFYFEKKISAGMQKKSQRVLVYIAMASFGYGLTALLNEVIGFPLQGLHIRFDKLAGYLIVNIIFLPFVLIVIGKLLGARKLESPEVQILGASFQENNKMQSMSKNTSSISVIDNKNIQNDTSHRLTFKLKQEGNSCPSIDENTTWEKALNEFESSNRNNGLWARLFSKHEGNEARAKAEYLQLRAEEFKKTELDEYSNEARSTQNTLFELYISKTEEECIRDKVYELYEDGKHQIYQFPNKKAAYKFMLTYKIFESKNAAISAVNTMLLTKTLGNRGYVREFHQNEL